MNTFGGTQFAFATLDRADFSEADLRYACFRDATLIRCSFRHAKNHSLTLTTGTSLESRALRDLLIDRISSCKNFADLNLQDVDLSGLDRHGFNFANANLHRADFSAADLQQANLSQINATGARFNRAKMAGATIENWNIDTATELDNIDCSHVYLAEDQQQRNPPEGDFAAGEFSKLYQQVAETVDFIVHSRQELAALLGAVETIQVEDGGGEALYVQSIERKEEAIVVKLKAAPAVDRDKLYKKIKKESKKRIQLLQAQCASLEQDKQFLQFKNQLKSEQHDLRPSC